MLQKPGSASSTPRTARSSNKQIQESPDDLIRKLSRLPPNKKCCDCNSKLPNIVNVSLGIFLCPTCAGIHRELPNNPRIKSIGHTTFTKEEVDMIQRQGGNDTMNAIYLANYHPSQERMKPPIDNSDIHILRNWILRKYKDKTWYRDPSSTSSSNASNSNSNSNANSNSNTHHHHHNNNNNKTSSNSSKNERGIAGMMRQPTVVANIPPKKKQSSSTTTPANNNNNNNNNNMVDLFDMGPSSTMTTTATTTTNTDSEWDAFSNSRIQQQQQQQPVTMLMNDFANFDTAVEVVTPSTTTNMVPSSFANFDNLTSQPQPVVSVPQLDHNISSSNNNSNNNTIQFANFSSTPAPPSQQPIQSGDDPNFGHFSSVATMTHNNNSDHNDGFANFDSITSTPITTLTTMSQPTNNNNNNNNNFTSVQPQLPMVSQVPPSQQHQHQQQPPPASFDKFDAFDSLQISSNVATTASTTTTTTNDDGSSSMIHQPTTSNTTTTTNTMTAPSSASNILKTTKFQSGQKVYYKSSSYSGPAEIIKVHFDDALEPFYTIVLTEANGKEKQTDDAHLSDYIDHMNQIHRNDDDTTALREEIKNLLMNLSMEQLQQIKQFIVRESVSTTPPNNNALSTTPSSFPTTMNTSEIPVLPVATLEMSVSLPPPPPEMNTNVVVQQQQDLPPPPQSIAPGQLTQANFSLSMPPPVQQQQQMSPPMDAPSFPQTQVHAPTQYPVATHDASQLNQNLPPQEQSGSFPMPSMNGAMTAMMPQQPSMMAGNGVSATGMMMGNVAPTTMINGPSAGVTISSGFGGIPSPDMGDESKPSVSSLSSLPPPPLTQTQQQTQPQYPSSSTTTMMNPAPPQGYMPQQMPQQPSSMMMTMNQMPSPGPTMMMMQYPIQQGTTIQQNPPITQMNGVVAAPQQQPMNQMQGMPGSNDQVPQSPLSPKGNPFDFY